jgi:hypothetical protein
MNYQLVLSPELGPSPTDFVTAWNDDPHLCSQAEAHLSSSKSSTYFDPSLLSMSIDFVIGVGIGLTSSALYELIKQLLQKRGIHKQTQLIEQEQPDGSHLLVITIDEE